MSTAGTHTAGMTDCGIRLGASKNQVKPPGCEKVQNVAGGGATVSACWPEPWVQ